VRRKRGVSKKGIRVGRRRGKSFQETRGDIKRERGRKSFGTVSMAEAHRVHDMRWVGRVLGGSADEVENGLTYTGRGVGMW